MTIPEILAATKTIAVVGLSSNPLKPSYGVAEYMQRAGYRIIPVNPNETEVMGEKAYPSLCEVPDAVDLVNVFRRPEFVEGIVEEAIAKGVRAIWLQLGVVHEGAAARARAAGLAVVMDRCLMIEHRRYGLSGRPPGPGRSPSS